jgi:hypothetical protein
MMEKKDQVTGTISQARAAIWIWWGMGFAAGVSLMALALLDRDIWADYTWPAAVLSYAVYIAVLIVSLLLLGHGLQRGNLFVQRKRRAAPTIDNGNPPSHS